MTTQQKSLSPAVKGKESTEHDKRRSGIEENHLTELTREIGPQIQLS